jgi:hypothetical protein
LRLPRLNSYKKWEKEDCTVEIAEAKLFFDDYEIVFRDDDARNSFVNSLLKIEAKSTDTINLTSFLGSAGRKKIAAKKLAAMEDMVINLVLKYKVQKDTEFVKYTNMGYDSYVVIE